MKKDTENEEITSAEDDDAEDSVLELAIETLTGDMRDEMLKRMRTMQKPWEKMTEQEQRSLNSDMDWLAKRIVKKAVHMIAARKRKVILGKLAQVTVKDGIKEQLEIGQRCEHRHDLIDAQGSAVLIVVADADEFTGEREPAKTEPDQPVFDNTDVAQGSNDDDPAADKAA